MYTIGTLAKTHRLYDATIRNLLKKHGIEPVQTVDTGSRTVALYDDAAFALVESKAEALKAKRDARIQRKAEAKPLTDKAVVKRLKRIEADLDLLLVAVNRISDMIGREQ
jgi:beta-phosphoglucomutase-like phosphatase (HAD superfamily)